MNESINITDYVKISGNKALKALNNKQTSTLYVLVDGEFIHTGDVRWTSTSTLENKDLNILSVHKYDFFMLKSDAEGLGEDYVIDQRLLFI